uniref:Uncharacterized protein n=1 Tax=Ficedula albicollis TaxID=59894 RepID=A0A803VMC6_FICAL
MRQDLSAVRWSTLLFLGKIKFLSGSSKESSVYHPSPTTEQKSTRDASSAGGRARRLSITVPPRCTDVPRDTKITQRTCQLCDGAPYSIWPEGFLPTHGSSKRTQQSCTEPKITRKHTNSTGCFYKKYSSHLLSKTSIN